MNREPLPAIPRYDPDFDVVANLPKDLVRRYRQMGRGLGNDTQQAKENYYALCKEDCGPYWQQFTPEPKVVQMEDAQQRTYYMAFRDPGDPDPPALSEEEWDWLETGCTGPAPESLSKTHWQPAPGSGAADCQSAYGEQRKEVDSHRGAETQSSSVGEGLAPSRSVEFESAAVLTTAGGHEVRPYASFDTSPEAHREPWPVNREPCSSLAGSISGQAVRCPELSDTSPETRREPWPVYREPCSFPERGPPPQGGGLNRRRYGPGSQ